MLESADDYPRIVVVLNDRWRVIECASGIQWILQRRKSAETGAGARWEGNSYCRTSEALIRCCRARCGSVSPSAMAVLAALPDWIESGAALMPVLEAA